MTTIIAQRLAAVDGIPVTVSSHSAPAPGCAPGAFCVMEKFAWITGQDWTDDPANCSRVISAFLRRFNDRTDQAGRDMVDRWVVENADRLVATANDGKERARRYIAADWAVRAYLPLWLELAGASDAAATLRALPEIVDPETALDAVSRVRQSAGLAGYWAGRRDLREKVYAAVKEAKEKHAATVADAAAAAADVVPAADVAAAAAATTAATAADADAVPADVATTAADVAAAATTAADVAAAAAAATADATAAADDDPWSDEGVYGQVYRAVRDRLDEKFDAIGSKQGALDALERMVSVA